jgi:hypothetical protein
MEIAWEALRRNSNYRVDFKEFKHNLCTPNSFKEFGEKWHLLSPLDPTLNFTELLERWRKGIGYGPRPFPLEYYYHKGVTNFPVYTDKIHLTFSDEIPITINKKANVSIQSILLITDNILDYRYAINRPIQRMRKEIPIIGSPSSDQNEIQLVINAKATREKIHDAIVKLLRSEGMGRTLAKPHLKLWRRRFEVWDLKENDRTLTFKNIALKKTLCHGKSFKKAEDLCRKDYAKCFELIYGRKYDPAAFRQELRAKGVSLDEVGGDCTKCSNRDCLSTGEVCPAKLKYVNQDVRSFSRIVTGILDVEEVGLDAEGAYMRNRGGRKRLKGHRKE